MRLNTSLRRIVRKGYVTLRSMMEGRQDAHSASDGTSEHDNYSSKVKDKFFCDLHDMYKYKNANGTFTCPFCCRGSETYQEYNDTHR